MRRLLVLGLVIAATPIGVCQSDDVRVPVPSDQQQAESLELIKVIFEQDYRKAKTSALYNRYRAQCAFL